MRIAAVSRLQSVLGRLGGGDDLRRKRMLGIVGGMATSLANRSLSVVIGFVSVPLTVHYLGSERYGAWIAISAILAWVGLADLGIANGLTNALTSDAARDRPDLLRTHLSNFALLMTAIGAVVGLLAALAWPHIGWRSVFGIVDPAALAEVRLSLALALAIFLARLPLTAANRVYLAYQEGHIGNYWAAAGNVLSLVALVLVTRTHGGLPLLVLAVSGAGLATEAASTLWLFTRHRPELRPGPSAIRRSGFGTILKVGYQFFLIQIMALLVFQTDVLVIAHFLGARAVPSYNLTYQLFNYAMLPQTLAFTYLWAAYNEAITRGDIGWVRHAVKWNLVLGLVWVLLCAAALVVIAKPFIGWWAGRDLIPSTGLVWMMAAWVVINAAMSTLACVLAAASHLRWQLVYSTLGAVSNLGLSILLVTRLGPVGVIGATVVTYLAFICIPALLDVHFLLKRLERKVETAEGLA